MTYTDMLVPLLTVPGQCDGSGEPGPASFFHASGPGGRLRGHLRPQIPQPVRPGKRPAHYEQRHDPPRLRAGMGLRAHQDVRSRQGSCFLNWHICECIYNIIKCMEHDGFS